MRGSPGSLNNSGKLFMEHALFIHRLGVSEALGVDGGAAVLRGPRREEGSTGKEENQTETDQGWDAVEARRRRRREKKKNITLPTAQ